MGIWILETLALAKSDRYECRAMEDWQQDLLDCPFYTEARDLAGWELIGEDGTQSFDGLLSDENKSLLFSRFARLIV